jgi:hypothetical protein
MSDDVKTPTIIYVEPSVLSRLLDMRLKPLEIDALEKLSDRTDVQLVTSEKTLEEFRDTQRRERRVAPTLLYRLINEVSAAPVAVPFRQHAAVTSRHHDKAPCRDVSLRDVAAAAGLTCSQVVAIEDEREPMTSSDALEPRARAEPLQLRTTASDACRST